MTLDTPRRSAGPSLRWLLTMLALLVPSSHALAQRVTVEMRVSATQVELGGLFRLRVSAEVQGRGDSGDVELPGLENFEIVRRSVSRPFKFSFGFGGSAGTNMSSSTVHDLTLRALVEGKQVIEPARLALDDREVLSNKIEIEVVPGAAPGVGPASPTGPGGQSRPPALSRGSRLPGSGGGAPSPSTAGPVPGAGLAPPGGTLNNARYDPDVFVHTVVDKLTPHVGEQVTVNVYLYVHGSLPNSPTVTQEPAASGFWVQDLLPPGRATEQYRRQVRGRSFRVYTLRRFAAFPLRDGPLTIGSTHIKASGASLLDLFTGGQAESLERRGAAVTLQVVPVPAGPGKSPIHVGQVTVESTLEPRSVQVGDALTLRLVVEGIGNLRTLRIPDPIIAGLEVLRPSVEDVSLTQSRVVQGRRSFEWLLLAREPATGSIAPFELRVFEPSDASLETRRTQALKFTVRPAPSSTATIPEGTDSKGAPQQATGPAPTQVDLPPLRSRSQLLRARPPIHRTRWFPWAVLMGPALLTLAWSSVHAANQLRKLRAQDPTGQQMKEARTLITRARTGIGAAEPGECFSLLTRAIQLALRAKLGESVSGLTHRGLRSELLKRGVREGLVTRVVHELERTEMLRFDPTQQHLDDLQDAVSRAVGLVKELERMESREGAR